MVEKRQFQSSDDVKAFILQGRIHAFHPDSAEHVAVVEYDPDGTCRVAFSDGRSDIGTWGFTEQGYWTSYQNFRDGDRHEFRLQLIAPQIMQAFHVTGARAFLQTALGVLPQEFVGE